MDHPDFPDFADSITTAQRLRAMAIARGFNQDKLRFRMGRSVGLDVLNEIRRMARLPETAEADLGQEFTIFSIPAKIVDGIGEGMLVLEETGYPLTLIFSKVALAR